MHGFFDLPCARIETCLCVCVFFCVSCSSFLILNACMYARMQGGCRQPEEPDHLEPHRDGILDEHVDLMEKKKQLEELEAEVRKHEEEINQTLQCTAEFERLQAKQASTFEDEDLMKEEEEIKRKTRELEEKRHAARMAKLESEKAPDAGAREVKSAEDEKRKQGAARLKEQQRKAAEEERAKQEAARVREHERKAEEEAQAKQEAARVKEQQRKAAEEERAKQEAARVREQEMKVAEEEEKAKREAACLREKQLKAEKEEHAKKQAEQVRAQQLKAQEQQQPAMIVGEGPRTQKLRELEDEKARLETARLRGTHVPPGETKGEGTEKRVW